MTSKDIAIKATDKKGGALFSSDIPEKFKEFYSYINQWMMKKDKKQEFCELLMLEDVQKSGFIKGRQIDDSFFKVGMDLSKK